MVPKTMLIIKDFDMNSHRNSQKLMLVHWTYLGKSAQKHIKI